MSLVLRRRQRWKIRSIRQAGCRASEGLSVLQAGDEDNSATGGVVLQRHGYAPICPACDRAHDERDRKSTRLNSSHQIISYAVFCLKKKTISNSLYYRIRSARQLRPSGQPGTDECME